LYDDVQKLFRPTFDKGRPAVQCGGWIGYIPLNDKYALEVNARVPIENLERLIGLASGYGPTILKKYKRYFAHTSEQPAALFEILSNHFLFAFDRICEAGLLKTYDREENIGTSPAGRIRPFESALRSKTSGRPVAVYSSYRRTINNSPNRVIRHSLEKIRRRNLELPDESARKNGVLRASRFAARLEGVNNPSNIDISPSQTILTLRHLPARHKHYADALLLAQLIISNAGLAIRGAEGIAFLPTILIDMSKVFEQYALGLLVRRLEGQESVAVLDGNKAGSSGAKLHLFESLKPGLMSPMVTPDIVVEIDGVTRLIIDAKYKLSFGLPDRSDLNQVITYGTRYACNKVMLLHAGRSLNQKFVEEIGKIGTQTLYVGHIDLGAEQIEEEEISFANAIADLLAA
jgi:5-methylcytosine-specific restriction endonuclease McrBC regulatory subunit McrC